MPTLRDVAAGAGVSIGTASNAFNRPELGHERVAVVSFPEIADLDSRRVSWRPCAARGRRSGRMPEPSRTVLPATLGLRGSTGPPAGRGPA